MFFRKTKLSCPSVARKNYVKLTAYTALDQLVERAPIVAASKTKNKWQHDGKVPPQGRTLRSCYGHVKGNGYSATIPAWSDMFVQVRDEGEERKVNITIAASENSYDQYLSVDYHEDVDFMPKDVVVAKLISPWWIESSDPDAKFLLSRHLLNSTPMQIPTGFMNFTTQHQTNIFCYVPVNYCHEYVIPFNEPMTQIHLMADKQLVVESVYDPEYQDKLHRKEAYRPYLKGNQLKLEKERLKQKT